MPRLLACDTIRLARGFQQRFREKVRPAQSVPRLFHEKLRPARGLHGLTREKLRPARPLQWSFREKTRPARHKTPILGHFSYAGRTISRSHPPSDRAGRTFSRTGSCDVTTLKPTTPLQPLMQANVKPPSPMLAPKQQPLKPPSPLQAKNAPKTPISHPQRRCRFQLGLGLREQRRWWFHLRLALREQRRRRFHARDFQCPRAIAEPGRAPSQRTEPHISDQAPLCGGRRRVRRARAGFEARRRTQ